MTTGSHRSHAIGGVRTRVQRAALIVGVVFLLIGVLGFIPGITTNYNQMQIAGYDSHATLLGIFEVSILNNIVHLLFGVAGLLMARTARAARTYLLGSGLIYLALAVYGVLVSDSHRANFIPVNTADNWLHFGLAVGMIGLGLFFTRDHRESGLAP